MLSDPMIGVKAGLELVRLNLKSVPRIGALSTVLFTELNQVIFPLNGLD
jgi:hypothetical protein